MTFFEWVVFVILFAAMVFGLTFLPWGRTYKTSEDEQREDDAAIDSVKGELETWDKAYARRRVRAGTNDAPPTSS